MSGTPPDNHQQWSEKQKEQGIYHDTPDTDTPRKSEQDIELPHRTSGQSDPDSLPQDDDRDHDAPNEDDHLERTVSLASTMSPLHEFVFVCLVCLAQFMTQVGLGQTMSIIHLIGNSFGITSPGELSWLIAAYSLTVGTFILLSGRLGDLFGYKKMLLIGFSWFSLWSMVAGLSIYSNHVLFNFARALQGIGASIVLPNGLAILGSTYPPGMKKNMAFSLFGALAPTGSIVGSVFAGLFALAWWPWAFFSSSITLVCIAIAGYFIIPTPPQPKQPPAREKRSLKNLISLLDLPAAIVGITSLVLINFAWNQAPVVGWSQPYVYVILIIGLLLIPLFFLLEVRFSKHPLLPFDALTPTVAFVLAATGLGWATFGIWFYYTWSFVMTLRGASPLLASAMISPVAPSGTLAAAATGLLLAKIRPEAVMTIALTAFTIGIILVATAPVEQTYWAQVFVSSVVTPWGMDMSFPAATIILSNAVSKEHQGIAASLVNTVVNYSISLGLGFAGTVEVNVNNGGLTQEDVLKGYRGAMYMGIGFAGGGMLLCLGFLGKGVWGAKKKGEKEKAESGGGHV
ncbi:hypothetical protein K402DRAFT_391145 [Aulographum hederae CBS 113979]|uniref:Major facilitator superfamily (MFS) profile domain-containing protein n=1 Tax=Aulographum hederae CBS 113979 TaxID=1176131 RepID=A0A6G1H7E4_9PEZI|nr:hypothetical protein K402DRAFT_391145 [Aulographum hederae CBS 113979]